MGANKEPSEAAKIRARANELMRQADASDDLKEKARLLRNAFDLLSKIKPAGN
jgi:hypothetical protein